MEDLVQEKNTWFFWVEKRIGERRRGIATKLVTIAIRMMMESGCEEDEAGNHESCLTVSTMVRSQQSL